MTEQYYALYVEGKENPIVTLRDSTLAAAHEIAQATGKKYRTEPITPEQAKAIKESITKCSPDLERLLTSTVVATPFDFNIHLLESYVNSIRTQIEPTKLKVPTGFTDALKGYDAWCTTIRKRQARPLGREHPLDIIFVTPSTLSSSLCSHQDAGEIPAYSYALADVNWQFFTSEQVKADDLIAVLRRNRNQPTYLRPDGSEIKKLKKAGMSALVDNVIAYDRRHRRY